MDGPDLDAQFAVLIHNEAMSGDNEMDHIRADAILVELLTRLGFTETIAAYENVGKWYA